MTPQATYVAAGGSNYNVYLLTKKGEFSWIHNPAYWISSVSLTSNGSYLAAGSFDDKVYLFNNTGTKLWDYQTKDDVYCVAISPDESFIAAGSWDDSLYVLNMEGKEFWNYSCGGNINSLSISGDSSILAVGSEDGAAYIFERNSTVFARLFGDARFLSSEGLKDLYLDKEAKTDLPLKGGLVTTESAENIVGIVPNSSSNVAGNTKSEINHTSDESNSTKNSINLPELLHFFRSPIVLLLAVFIVALSLKNKTFKKQNKNEDFEDFENLEDENNRQNH
jgi:WD40 repeat protein